MEINPQYGKPIYTVGNANSEEKNSAQSQQRESVLSSIDKDASYAITSMGKSLVSQSFKPARTLEELQQQNFILSYK